MKRWIESLNHATKKKDARKVAATWRRMGYRAKIVPRVVYAVYWKKKEAA